MIQSILHIHQDNNGCDAVIRKSTKEYNMKFIFIPPRCLGVNKNDKLDETLTLVEKEGFHVRWNRHL